MQAYSESLADEVKSFGIKILICEPGGFLTQSIKNVKIIKGHEIQDYDDVRAEVQAPRQGLAKTFVGDARKGMKVLVDIVRGDGEASDRPWPLYLFLGDKAHDSVRDQAERTLKVAEEWKDISYDLNVDE